MTIDIANPQHLAALDTATLRALCAGILRQHGVQADLSLCYVDDAAIRTLNAQYLGRDEVTDVLAFPLDDDTDPDGVNVLGEIVVSVEKALAEAAARDLPIEREIALYTAHGLLHLLGYDDHQPDDTARMREAEREALARVGLL